MIKMGGAVVQRLGQRLRMAKSCQHQGNSSKYQYATASIFIITEKRSLAGFRRLNGIKMEKFFKPIGIIAVLLMLTACGTSSQYKEYIAKGYDVSGSAYKVNVQKPPISQPYKIIYENKANQDIRNDGLLLTYISWSFPSFLIKPKDTVESDLHEFFDSHISQDANAKRGIRVILNKVNAYWINPVAASVPFVNFLTLGMDHEHFMDVKVTVEIEENGKVLSTYIFEDTVTVKAPVNTDEAKFSAYKLLISTYRKKMFNSLENDFIARYL